MGLTTVKVNDMSTKGTPAVRPGTSPSVRSQPTPTSLAIPPDQTDSPDFHPGFPRNQPNAERQGSITPSNSLQDVVKVTGLLSLGSSQLALTGNSEGSSGIV